MVRTARAVGRQFASVGSAHPLAIAVAVFVGWTTVTYLLEGARLTLLRPEATGNRLLYAIVANVLVGTVLALWVREIALGDRPRRTAGFRNPRRTVVGVVVAFVLGAGLFLGGSPATTDPVVVANAFAQTFVVSTAEVVVCWVLVGVAIEQALRKRVGPSAAKLGLLVVASLAFGLYHVAHSPPFNTVRMIVVLSLVGVLTSLVFLASRDCYATIVFHNFLAVTGVTRALASAGELATYTSLVPMLWVTALVALVALVGADYLLVRRRQPHGVGRTSRLT